jgi:hypothetical protein
MMVRSDLGLYCIGAVLGTILGPGNHRDQQMALVDTQHRDQQTALVNTQVRDQQMALVDPIAALNCRGDAMRRPVMQLPNPHASDPHTDNANILRVYCVMPPTDGIPQAAECLF